ncbi:alpha-ketoacid dehydrogenase subunit beta [Bradyrhizobium sp. U87765 SZCCT0131]|uniref:alpha-ketoacid dehydrogenase subunit beta n=1 Tax=unclassified Bradyrhizobium TaxID=2631580 RepID=UPI001BA70AC5|nr:MULTISPECIES: pyruvate dehydrogenase complex E1 component subunit beta [unclassified Bradyrhizobium]MBR1217828.1 alpha-ketoacid dehydrogenase subunit beta [Bradyrhizobium sp. U87765 SZCCT0131]MBR1261226.1 alpha-ketoacid dehydrogenase subunit beta [Bradyrhizobium sp. U87765 SZCCT0134]MBR1303326.1 alpha-ketoacid dehydrogenase subunit beta [Bradyrhizobium sp. U87765 SZCCT0110]MBR1318932.1 alpha-ketoacid dehydrogenase subunit beta [Bradyrhizobium sp. U87765 SZCCT0109]MBR1347257.1 alpha-ketoacid
MTVTSMTVVEAARMTLRQEMQRDPDIWVLGEDIRHGGVFGQYKGLVDEFGPERIVDTPIAEATMVGAAVGAALAGTRPIVETRFSDFALSAIDEIVNQAAKVRYMFGGQGRVPIVVRMPSGLRKNSAAQHSQSLEAWFAHIPGLVVTAPATPADARGLLLTALRGEDPVMHLEAKELWQVTGDVPDAGEPIPFGVGRVVRAGSDLTVVTWGTALHESLRAGEVLQDHGASIEIIDLRTLWPWDKALVLRSVAQTRRLVVVHESVRDVGIGAEIAATVAEELHETLVAPVRRVASPRIPVGYSPPLEDVYRVRASKIVATVAPLLGIDPSRIGPSNAATTVSDQY